MTRTSHAAGSHVRRWCLALALGGLSLVAQAATTFPGFMATLSAQSTTVAAASNGTLLAVKAPGTLVAGGGWQMAGNYGVAAGAAGATKVGADVVVNVAGKNVGTQVTKEISKADIAGAVVGCLGGAVSCALSVGVPLATAFFSLSGARLNNGELEIRPTGDAYCYTAPCYEWKPPSAALTAYFRDPVAACQAYAAYISGQAGGTPWVFVSVTAPNGSTNGARDCNTTRAGYGNFTNPLQPRTAQPLSPTWYPTTPQEVKDKLIAQPTNPNIGIVPELEKAGIDWTGFGWMNPTPPTTITGPATVTGPAIVTSRPDGSTSTKQETTPLTYSGPKVTAGPKVETVVERSPTGQTTGTTTTTTTPGTEAAPDAPTKAEEPPKDPPLQCDDDKYPNSLGCVELGEPGDGEIPKSSFTLTYLPEVVGGGGTCPADRIGTMVLTGRQYVAWDFQRTCSWISSYVKPVVILLATMAAFLILMPGKVET